MLPKAMDDENISVRKPNRGDALPRPTDGLARGLFWVAASATLGLMFVFSTSVPVNAQTSAPHDFIGAGQCRTCHAAEYTAWAKGPHAGAYQVLSPDDRRDRRCLGCHTMVVDEPTPDFEGVQCESCHGPGRYYARNEVMRDKVVREKLLLEQTSEKTCAKCHTSSTPSLQKFDFASAKEKIRHWK